MHTRHIRTEKFSVKRNAGRLYEIKMHKTITVSYLLFTLLSVYFIIEFSLLLIIIMNKIYFIIELTIIIIE